MNNKKNIDLAPKESNSKKKFHEEIFMPKFFLNLINLAKKAEKLRKKLNKPVNQDLVLDFKTSFSHMPKIHFLSCKSSSKNKLDYSEKNLNKRYNNIKDLFFLSSFKIITCISFINFKTCINFFQTSSFNKKRFFYIIITNPGRIQSIIFSVFF